MERKGKIPLTTTLRFPLLFGGFLALVSLGFIYRDSWLGDIDAERSRLFYENAESKKVLEDFKKQHGKS